MPSTWSFTQFVKEKLTFQKLNSRFQGIKDILDTCYTTNDASSLSTANKLVLRDSNGDAAIRNLTLSQLNAHSITDIFEADGTTVKRATTITNLPTAVRQTVIQGQVDANGQANFLQAGSTPLTIDILADSIPLILSFAYGNNTTYGPVNFIEAITSNQTAFWSNLPSNQSFIQLYIDRNISTGELSGGYTLLETAYGTTPSHANNQHWYDYGNTTFMKVSDGSSWSNVQRIMIGECATNASSVTSVICYALKGKYQSPEISVPTAGVLTTVNHNIGVVPLISDIQMICKIPDGGYSVGDITGEFAELINATSATDRLVSSRPHKTRNTLQYTTGSVHIVMANKSTGVYFSPTISTLANWRFLFYADRGW
jgi:hypothetical protein